MKNDNLDSYDLGQIIGKGGFASVYRAIHRTSGREVAIKITEKDRMSQLGMTERIANEVKIHSTLPHHHNVINVISTFEDDHNIYLVMDLCVKGNLYKELRRKKRFAEPEAKHVIKQLLSAVSHLHREGIVHRDLKLSNILIEAPPVSNITHKREREGKAGLDYYTIKICDFGLAIQIEHPDEEHFTLCGTPNYIAPEIADHKAHGYPVDLWSIGCLFYTLVVGSPPFEQRISIEEKSDDHHGSHNNTTVFKNMKSSDYNIPEEVTLSTQGKHFLSSLLDWNPSERASAADTLKHPFFHSSYPSHGASLGTYPGIDNIGDLSKNSFDSFADNLQPIQHSSSTGSMSIGSGMASPGGSGGRASQRATPITQVIHQNCTPTVSRNNTPMRAPKATKVQRRPDETDIHGDLEEKPHLTVSVEADVALDDNTIRWRASPGFEQARTPTAKHSKHYRLYVGDDQDEVKEQEGVPRTIPASLSALPMDGHNALKQSSTPTCSMNTVSHPISRHPSKRGVGHLGGCETGSAVSGWSSHNDDMTSNVSTLSLHLPHPSAEPSLVMPLSSVNYYNNNGGHSKNIMAKVGESLLNGKVRPRGTSGAADNSAMSGREEVSASQRQTTDLSKMRGRLHTIASGNRSGDDDTRRNRSGDEIAVNEYKHGDHSSIIADAAAYKRVPLPTSNSPFVSMGGAWERHGQVDVSSRVSHSWLDEVSSLRKSLVSDHDTENKYDKNESSQDHDDDNNDDKHSMSHKDQDANDRDHDSDVLLSLTSLSEYNNENSMKNPQTRESPTSQLIGPRPALGELPRKGFSLHYRPNTNKGYDDEYTVRSSVTQSTEAFTIPDASTVTSQEMHMHHPSSSLRHSTGSRVSHGSRDGVIQLQYTPHPPSVPFPGAGDRYTHSRSSMYSSMNRSAYNSAKSSEMHQSLQGARVLAKSWSSSSPKSTSSNRNDATVVNTSSSNGHDGDGHLPGSLRSSTPSIATLPSVGSRAFLLWQTEVRDLTPFCYVTPNEEILLYSIERDLLFCVPMLKKNGSNSYARMLFKANTPLQMSVGHVDSVMMREIQGIVAGKSLGSSDDNNDVNHNNRKSSASTAFGRMYSQEELRILEAGISYTSTTSPSRLRASASMAPDAALWVAQHRITRLPEPLLKVYSRIGCILKAVRSNAPRISLYLKRATIWRLMKESMTCDTHVGVNGMSYDEGNEISMMTDTAYDSAPSSPHRTLTSSRSTPVEDDQTIDCKCMLMCNDPLPNFIIQWIDGTRLRYSLSTGNLRLDCPATCPVYKSLPATLHPLPTSPSDTRYTPRSTNGDNCSGSSNNSVSEALLLGLDDGHEVIGLTSGYDYREEKESIVMDSTLDTTAETTLDMSCNNNIITATNGHSNDDGNDYAIAMDTSCTYLDEEGSQGPEPSRRPCPLPSPKDAQQADREQKKEREHALQVAKAVCYETRLTNNFSQSLSNEWEDIPERLKGYMQIAQMAMQQVVKIRKECQEAEVDSVKGERQMGTVTVL